jgi:hypothetical protein
MEGRRWEDAHPPSRDEHNDLKSRVQMVEAKLDRITWLIIATLAVTIVDIFTKVSR